MSTLATSLCRLHSAHLPMSEAATGHVRFLLDHEPCPRRGKRQEAPPRLYGTGHPDAETGERQPPTTGIDSGSDRRSHPPGIVAPFAVPHPPLIIPGWIGRRRFLPPSPRHDAEVGRCTPAEPPDTVESSRGPHAIMYADYIPTSPRTWGAGGFSMFSARPATAVYDQEFVQRPYGARLQAEGLGWLQEGREGTPTLDHGTMMVRSTSSQRHHLQDLVVHALISWPSLASRHYRPGMLVAWPVSLAGAWSRGLRRPRTSCWQSGPPHLCCRPV